MTKSTKYLILALISVVFLTACAGVPKPKETLDQMNTQQLLEELQLARNTGPMYVGWKTANTSQQEYLRDLKSKIIKINPNWDNKINNAILSGEIIHGMNKDQVLATWGRPAYTAISKEQENTSERWNYYKYSPQQSAFSAFNSNDLRYVVINVIFKNNTVEKTTERECYARKGEPVGKYCQ